MPGEAGSQRETTGEDAGPAGARVPVKQEGVGLKASGKNQLSCRLTSLLYVT